MTCWRGLADLDPAIAWILFCDGDGSDDLEALPWNIVLLFGGGFALAKGFTESGLSEYIGQQFIDMQTLEPMALVGGISAIVVFLTEVTSNTATSQILLPVVASVAKQIELNPLLLMLPVTLSASMAFMMPASVQMSTALVGSSRINKSAP